MIEDGVVPELLLGQQVRPLAALLGPRQGSHLQGRPRRASTRWRWSCAPAHDPDATWGFVGVVVSTKDLSASVWRWHRDGGTEWTADKVITIPAEPAAGETCRRRCSPSGPCRRWSPTSTSRSTTGCSTSLAGAPGSSAVRRVRPGAPARGGLGAPRRDRRAGRASRRAGERLAGGPQMVEVSRDGRRVYITNSLYGSWDDQFYPHGVGAWMAKLDADPGGRADRRRAVLPARRGLPRPRAHQVRLQGGDASSDSYCYRSVGRVGERPGSGRGSQHGGFAAVGVQQSHHAALPRRPRSSPPVPPPAGCAPPAPRAPPTPAVPRARPARSPRATRPAPPGRRPPPRRSPSPTTAPGPGRGRAGRRPPAPGSTVPGGRDGQPSRAPAPAWRRAPSSTARSCRCRRPAASSECTRPIPATRGQHERRGARGRKSSSVRLRTSSGAPEGYLQPRRQLAQERPGLPRRGEDLGRDGGAAGRQSCSCSPVTSPTSPDAPPACLASPRTMPVEQDRGAAPLQRDRHAVADPRRPSRLAVRGPRRSRCGRFRQRPGHA